MADTVFFCTSCGHESGKWLGQCPGCGEWNCYAEQPSQPKKKKAGAVPRRGAAAIPVTEAAAAPAARTPTGLDGLDRVLGGGLVPGSLVLLAGEPGIGKSTLLLQVAASLARDCGPVVYVTGEESAEQIALRARRIGGLEPNLFLLPETSCESVLAQIEDLEPQLVVVDSVQTAVLDSIDAVAGSVSQVRQVASRFQHFAKTRGVPVVLVGHVTKDGMIAGPEAPRAPGRCRDVPRRRTRARTARAASREKPFRHYRRARALFDDRQRSGGGTERLGMVARGPAERRSRVPQLRSPSKGRCPSWSRSRRWSRRRLSEHPAGWLTGSTRRASPSSSRCSSGTPASALRTGMSSSISSVVCRCASPPSILQSRPRCSRRPQIYHWLPSSPYSERSVFSAKSGR